MNYKYIPFLLLILFVLACTSKKVNHTGSAINDTASWPASFGFGRIATAAEIAAVDIDIMPDGKGLPAGSGNIPDGKVVFAAKCSACHGITGAEASLNKLVGALGDTTKAKTIGNYWPYSTTLFDYIRRAMPQTAPGSLTNDEVYSLTAWLLFANKIIDSTTVLNAQNLAKIEMPAKHFFVNDDRKGGSEIR